MNRGLSKSLSLAAAAAGGAVAAVLISRNFFDAERRISHHISAKFRAGDAAFIRTMSHLFGPALIPGNEVRMLRNGIEIFPAMLDAIGSAQRTITMENFVWTEGRSTRQFAEALIAQPAATPEKEANLYGGVAPAEFAKRDDVQQPIDPQKFDAKLLSAAIFHRTNAVRVEHDLRALTYNAKAADAAQKHSEAIANGDYLSHGTPNKKKNLTPYERLKNEGLNPHFSAENIAFNFLLRYQSGKPFFTREENGKTVYSYEPDGKAFQPHTYASFAADIVQQWLDSPPHRKNLLSKEPTQLGVGAALSAAANGFDEIYSDQDFFAPFPGTP